MSLWEEGDMGPFLYSIFLYDDIGFLWLLARHLGSLLAIYVYYPTQDKGLHCTRTDQG